MGREGRERERGEGVPRRRVHPEGRRGERGAETPTMVSALICGKSAIWSDNVVTCLRKSSTVSFTSTTSALVRSSSLRNPVNTLSMVFWKSFKPLRLPCASSPNFSIIFCCRVMSARNPRICTVCSRNTSTNTLIPLRRPSMSSISMSRMSSGGCFGCFGSATTSPPSSSPSPSSPPVMGSLSLSSSILTP